MRRFVTLFVLLLCTVPFGVSISGCSHNVAPTFCNGGDSGIVTGQVTNITLGPIVYGISLNFSEIGQVSTPSATDCKGSTASVGNYVYGTTDMTIADVQPTTGRLCGGTWNRNSGGGIPDYTYCIPTNKTGTAYISASADGVTSNPLPIFVHGVVTSIVLGAPSSNCATDPATNCSPSSITYSASSASCPTSTAYPSNPLLANGCCSIPPSTVSPPSSNLLPYSSNSCFSQNTTTEFSARVYAGTGNSQTNISCQAGHLQFSAQSGTSSSAVVTIDQNGVATANQPGSVLITANVADAASSAGFFSTCPPASITLAAPGSAGSGTSTNPVVINENTPQPLTATILDTKGASLTGLSLEYVTTSPTTIPTISSGSVSPTLAGSASITAICLPPSCNSAPYNQIGLSGTGTPVTSNSLDVTTPGTNSTVLYMASTNSQYIVTRDFTQTSQSTPFYIPYVPNSMVISNDGSTIYMGSSTALMVLNAVNTLSLSRTDLTSPGYVLAVSPDGSQIVVTDPVKGITTIESSSGSVVSTYGATANHAEYTPDSQTVYISAGGQLLVYSDFTGWTNVSPATSGGTPVTDVAVTVPSVGAYFAGPITTARGYCPISTPTSPTTESNVFYPQADTSSAYTDRIAATNDGQHILGATVNAGTTLSDLHVKVPIGACPTTGGLAFSNSLSTTVLSSISVTGTPPTGGITGILPASDSSIAFVTYTGSSGLLPAYAPASSGTGTLSYVKLSGSATAPVAGVLSSDNSTIYIGTSGDNLVHLITRSTLTDSSTLAPNLTTPAGAPAVVNLIVQKPRKTT